MVSVALLGQAIGYRLVGLGRGAGEIDPADREQPFKRRCRHLEKLADSRCRLPRRVESHEIVVVVVNIFGEIELAVNARIGRVKSAVRQRHRAADTVFGFEDDDLSAGRRHADRTWQTGGQAPITVRS